MPRQPLILLVEDEATVRQVVRKYLERDHYRVLESANGREALQIIREQQPDLIILDIMLPELDGFEIVQQLRGAPDPAAPGLHETPIIVLSARREEVDRVFGFQLGVDDYVVKPFSPMELVARVQAVLRRSQARSQAADKPLAHNDLVIDERSRRVTVRDVPVSLTAREFDLLLFLARHPGQVFTRAQLIEEVWGYEFDGDESTVTVHIRRLREKIERDPTAPDYLHTVHGVGYSFNPA